MSNDYFYAVFMEKERGALSTDAEINLAGLVGMSQNMDVPTLPRGNARLRYLGQRPSEYQSLGLTIAL
jgi:hypothetical protein